MAEQGLIIARPAAEISTKSHRTRHGFQRRLRANIADALERAGLAFEARAYAGGFLLKTGAPDEALGVLGHVFGLGSLSPVAATAPATVESIVERGTAAFAERVRGRTFAVRAKKLGRGPFPFASMDVERALGAGLNGPGRVDLTNPDVTVHVELVGETAYLFDQRRPGAGGLPAGVQGRAVVLLSGGFDSAVAAWRVMRRGVGVDFMFCNLGGAAYERMVLQVAKVLTELWAHGLRPRFYVVDFAPVLETLRAGARAAYWQVVLKRLMYRAACRLAGELGAAAIVTGESIGQVSSQTMDNLNAIDAVADLPVLRPLVGCDKREIMDEARAVGTAPISERVKEYCAIAPGRPIVSASRARVDAEEAKLDLDVLWRALAARKSIDVRAVTAADLRTPYMFTSEIPADAVVIDCRPRPLYRDWHVPEARHRDPFELIKGFRDLDRERTYVLYCTHGTQTPYIAEVMQQAGYEAYAFEGGISTVKRYVEAREPA